VVVRQGQCRASGLEQAPTLGQLFELPTALGQLLRTCPHCPSHDDEHYLRGRRLRVGERLIFTFGFGSLTLDENCTSEEKGA